MSDVRVTPTSHEPGEASIPGLASLQPFEQYQPSVSHIFSSLPSLRWYYRKHRAELIAAGAVVELAGRLFVNPPVFAEKAMAIGAKVAAARGD